MRDVNAQVVRVASPVTDEIRDLAIAWLQSRQNNSNGWATLFKTDASKIRQAQTDKTIIALSEAMDKKYPNHNGWTISSKTTGFDYNITIKMNDVEVSDE